MQNARRQFLRGGWLRSLASAPVPQGEREIASVVVHARPDRMDEARASILGAGAEIAAEDARGKFVVVIEAGDGERLGETLTTLSSAPGVVAATLVYHAIDRTTGSQEGTA
jgi:nitrate reductase NapAB chaperone NapD